jgi:hypothetical protein
VRWSRISATSSEPPNKPLTDGACAPLLNAIAFVQRTPSGST